MRENRKFIFYLVAISVFVYALLFATRPADAYTINNTRLLVFDRVTLERGFMARSFDDQLQIAILPKRFTQMTVKIAELGEGTVLPKNKSAVTKFYRYSLITDNKSSGVPVVISMSDPSAKYKISFYSDADRVWRDLPTTVDSKNKRLRATLTELTGEIVVTEERLVPVMGPITPVGNLTAASAVVYDEESGQVLFEKNSDVVRPIASLTKLMTVLVFLDHNPGWDTLVTISKSDKVGGAMLPVVPGDVTTVDALFNATLIGSKNDAARALMRSTGLTEVEFVKLMNKKALELGLKNTRYVEPTGLDERNVSTAREILTISQKVFSEPQVYSACTIKNYKFIYTHDGYRWSIKIPNTNKLVERDLNVTGGKTGYTTEAGYNLVTQATKLNDSHELIALVLGAKMSQNYEEVYKLLKHYL